MAKSSITGSSRPAQVQLHHDGGYHLKFLVTDDEGNDVMESFALGRKAVEKLMSCGQPTGGPTGFFDASGWDCGGRDDCCVVANGHYTEEMLDGERTRFDVTFDDGAGFAGGSFSVKARKGTPMKGKFSWLSYLTAKSCNGLDARDVPRTCPGQPMKARQSTLL